MTKINRLTESRPIMKSERAPALRLTLGAPVGSLLDSGEEPRMGISPHRLGRPLLALEKT